MPYQGYFVISDISGYTAFMVGSELEHAHDILKTLFDTLLDSIQPPLLISNFQGDAILMYAPEANVQQGQTLLELIEAIYIQFIQARERMRLNTTCTCAACSNINLLDLKLFVHYGSYMIHDMRGKQELSGPDLILVHRLLKSPVREQLPVKAFTLFTDAAVKALSTPQLGQVTHSFQDQIEHFGTVETQVVDLAKLWEQRRADYRRLVTEEEAFFSYTVDLAATPAQVWDLIHAPETKAFIRAARVSILTQGRTGVGSAYHCDHGLTKSVHTIVDWQPFEYATEEITMPMGGIILATQRLTPTATGTQITYLMKVLPTTRQFTNLFYRWVGRIVTTVASRQGRGDLQRLVQLVTQKRQAGTITDQTPLATEIELSHHH